MKARNRNSALAVKVYARHGDICGNAPHCESLGCTHVSPGGTRVKIGPDDYVQTAQFMYFQEAIDYCQDAQGRGVSMRLISWICPGTPHQTDYPAPGPAQEAGKGQPTSFKEKRQGLPAGVPLKVLADLPADVLDKMGALDPFQDSSPVHDPDVIVAPGPDGYRFLGQTSKGTRALLAASVQYLQGPAVAVECPSCGRTMVHQGELYICPGGHMRQKAEIDAARAKALQEKLERAGCTVQRAQPQEPICRQPRKQPIDCTRAQQEQEEKLARAERAQGVE